MVQSVVYAVVVSAALFGGALAGCVWDAPKRVRAVATAFAAGALITALAVELFDDAFTYGGAWRAVTGLFVGATVFVAVDEWLERRARRPGAAKAAGRAILAGAVLDGVPENLALGVSLLTGGGTALLVAIVVGNLPEGLAGASEMRRDGERRRRILLFWLAAAAVSGLAVVVGRVALADVAPRELSWPLGIAAGAVLATLADTLMPEAYAEGGPAVALATAAGFAVSFAVSTL